MICGSGGSKSRLAKAAGAEPSGQMRDEKLHAVVARSVFPSQNVQDTPRSDHFWKLRCGKKCTLLWREAHFQVKMLKAPHARTTFEGLAGARDSSPCPNWSKREGFVGFPKTMAGVRHLQRICKDACRVAGAVQETWDVRRSRRWFPYIDGLHLGASDL